MVNAVYDYGGPGSSSVGRGGALQTANVPGGNNPVQYGQTQGQFQMANQLFNAFQAADATPNQLTLNKLGALQQQRDLLGASQDTQSGYLNDSMQNQLAMLQLQNRGIGIQQGQLDRSNALLPQQRALQQQQYGISGEQLGLQGKGLDINERQLGLQGRGLDVQDQAIQQQVRDLLYGNDRAKQNLVSSQAARGASNTPGTALGQQDLAAQLQSSLSGIDRAKQGQGLAREGLGLSKEQLGLSRDQLALQQRGLGIQQQQSDLSYNEQLAQNKDAQKSLDIMKERTGLDEKEINNRTQQALDQLGLSTSLSTLDVYKAMQDTRMGLYNPVSQVFSYLYQLSGLNPFMSAGMGG